MLLFIILNYCGRKRELICGHLLYRFFQVFRSRKQNMFGAVHFYLQMQAFSRVMLRIGYFILMYYNLPIQHFADLYLFPGKAVACLCYAQVAEVVHLIF